MKLIAYLIIIASSSVFYLGSSEVSAKRKHTPAKSKNPPAVIKNPSATDALNYLRNKTMVGRKCYNITFAERGQNVYYETRTIRLECPAADSCGYTETPTTQISVQKIKDAMKNNSKIEVSQCGDLEFN